MMQFNHPDAPPLLVAANKAVQAWLYPTMDGNRLMKAMVELEKVVAEANKEYRLACMERSP